MHPEAKGELIGQICQYETKLKAVNNDIFHLSCQVDKLVDNLCKINNDEYLKLIHEVQYTIGKLKGLIR